MIFLSKENQITCWDGPKFEFSNDWWCSICNAKVSMGFIESFKAIPTKTRETLLKNNQHELKHNNFTIKIFYLDAFGHDAEDVARGNVNFEDAAAD